MKKIVSSLTAVLALLVAVSGARASDLESRMIEYGGGRFEGYWVQPKKPAKSRSAILMIHNWLGVSDETRFQADRFAKLGYVVFAADIYGKGQRPKDGSEAGPLSGKYKADRKLFRERLNLGLNFLKAQPGVDAKKIAALGYCFGGTGVIELARSGADFAAAVSFHGGLDSPSPQDGAHIKAQILVHHGAQDPYVKSEDLAAFEKEMRDHHVRYTLYQYPGAVHSFTDKGAGSDVTKGVAYNAKADRESFARTQAFLERALK